MNVYDSGRMADILSPFGYSLTDSPEEANLAILNTCHIREKAEEKVYSDLGRLRPLKEGEDRDIMIAVAGCVAQAEGEEILKRAPYVDIVLGPQTYHRLPELIARAKRKEDKVSGKGRGVVDIDFPVEPKFDFLPDHNQAAGPSAYLAIQEGCDKFCSFCVVSYTRGAEYSRPVQSIYDEALRLVEGGTKEITLLGQNVNAYHGVGPLGGKEWGLGRLMEKLSDIQGLERIRYMTSHPQDMDDELIEAHGNLKKVMPFLHLPVQSGSNRILHEMNRKHTIETYIDIIRKTKEIRPDIALSSDFIVGFPGETENDFQATLDLVKEVGYAQAYSFKYSPRQGTPGALMDKQVAEEIKSERLKRLQDLLSQQQLDFNKKSIGKTVPILLDRVGKKDYQLVGRTPHMQSVYLDVNPRLYGTTVNVEIIGAFQNSLTGNIVTTEEIFLKT